MANELTFNDPQVFAAAALIAQRKLTSMQQRYIAKSEELVDAGFTDAFRPNNPETPESTASLREELGKAIVGQPDYVTIGARLVAEMTSGAVVLGFVASQKLTVRSGQLGGTPVIVLPVKRGNDGLEPGLPMRDMAASAVTAYKNLITPA